MNKLDSFNHSIPIVAFMLILSLPISAFFLRQNNLTMIELRDEVLRIDEQTGDLEQIAPALDDLRQYVLTHMNASLGENGIALPGAYNTAVETARRQAESSGSANQEIYRLAQEICEDPNVPLTARAQCLADFVLNNSEPGSDPAEFEVPPVELYTYNFVSPLWSFDLAGVSVLVTISLFIWLMALVVWQVVLGKIDSIISNDPLE